MPLTNTEKSRNREKRKNEIARMNGYPSWRKMETAILTAIESGKEFVVKIRGGNNEQ